MTTTEMLASVEAQIRKDIPRLMELREGCLIEYFKGRYAYECKVSEVFPSYFNVYLNGEIESINFDLSGHTFQIIGHEIMLNDILDWLNEITLISYCMTANGEFFYRLITGAPETHCDVYWDLSKPYLKDQSEELIKFLYYI